MECLLASYWYSVGKKNQLLLTVLFPDTLKAEFEPKDSKQFRCVVDCFA